MVSTATHPKARGFSGAARTFAGLLVLAALLFSVSTDAFAQDAVQARYEQLRTAAESAKEAHAVNPNGATLQIMNDAVDTFQRFEQANDDLLRDLTLDKNGDASRTLAAGGPDGYGYEYCDINEPGCVQYSWIDITPTANAKTTVGILVATGDDVSSINSGIFSPVVLGTPFTFYGLTHTQLVPATNGYISTDPTDGGPDLSNDCPLPANPSTGGGARIYPLHDDLVSDVWWDFFPVCPHPSIAGSCDIFSYVSDHFAGSGPFEFQVLLDGVTGDFIYQYLDAGNNNTEAGGGSTTGIQDYPPVTTGLTYACNTFGSLPGPGDPPLAVRFIHPDPFADLAVGKIVNDNTPDLGQTVTFTVTVTNVFGFPAPGVRLEDVLPAGLAYVSNTATQGTYNGATGQWNVGTIGVGATETLTINATVTATTPITNVAEITFSGIPDPNAANDRATVTLNPQYADLSVRKSVTAFNINGGVATATYQIRVFNAGPQNVCGVMLQDRASAPMTFAGGTTSQGVALQVGFNPPVIDWNVGCINSGASATMNLTFTAPDLPGNILVNVAEVTASNLPDPDSVPGDGTGDDFAASVAGFRADPDFVRGPGAGALTRDPSRFSSDLVLTKTAADASVPAGGSTTWTITVTNEGPQNNAGVMVQDILPACLTATSVVPSAGTSFDAATGIWNVDKLKVGASATLAVTTTFGAGCSGSVTNTAEIIASNLPDPDSFFSLINPPTPDESDDATVTVTEATAKAEVSDAAPVRLLGNYPNPFNPETVIPFALREAGQVRLAVYDLLGRQVQLLVDGSLAAGTHEVTFRASSMPTGVYLVRLEAAGQVQTQRITLMK